MGLLSWLGVIWEVGAGRGGIDLGSSISQMLKLRPKEVKGRTQACTVWILGQALKRPASILFFFPLTEIWLIYNVVFISGGQQTEFLHI